MRILTVLAAAALAAMPASAVTLFSQNFDSVLPLNNTLNVPGFTVTGGVDLIRNGTAGVFCAGNAGRCLDLVGSPNIGSVQSALINFAAGQIVTVSFDVSGNPRAGTPPDIFNFALDFTSPKTIANFQLISGFVGSYGGNGAGVTSFGTYTESLIRNRPFHTYVLSFVPTTAGALRLSFGAGGPNDAAGPILDNVLVLGTVPEPGTWMMLLTGFGMVGLASRRRRPATAR